MKSTLSGPQFPFVFDELDELEGGEERFRGGDPQEEQHLLEAMAVFTEHVERVEQLTLDSLDIDGRGPERRAIVEPQSSTFCATQCAGISQI